jgi:hypothetical protein
MRSKLLLIALTLIGVTSVQQAHAQVTVSPPDVGGVPPPAGTPPAAPGTSEQSAVTVLNVPDVEAQTNEAVDFVNAKGWALPTAARRSQMQARDDLLDALRSQRARQPGGHSIGWRGNGKFAPVNLGVPQRSALTRGPGEVTPQEFGLTGHPFSTARADLLDHATNEHYPYRASGKLFFKIGSDTHWCTASLIGKGIVVTAAHCVAEFGAQRFYSHWRFVPGYRNGVGLTAPWKVKQAYILTKYFDGSDFCAEPGIVCESDVAVLVLKRKRGDYPGTELGWYGYGWDDYGFNDYGIAQITQIGYPFCLDAGLLMQRNDSYGYKSMPFSNNTIIGSLMCSGSSGGPWVVNFGIRPNLIDTFDGAEAASNIVVGVTSWGYISPDPKEQGASPFTSANIVPLVNQACTASPRAC